MARALKAADAQLVVHAIGFNVDSVEIGGKKVPFTLAEGQRVTLSAR